MIMVGCSRCCVVGGVREGVVLCGVWCVVLVLVWVFGRGGVVCRVGGACSCVFVLFCFFLNSLLSLSCSLFLSSLFSLLSSLPLPLLSSHLAAKHCGKNRSKKTAAKKRRIYS